MSLATQTGLDPGLTTRPMLAAVMLEASRPTERLLAALEARGCGPHVLRAIALAEVRRLRLSGRARRIRETAGIAGARLARRQRHDGRLRLPED